MSDYERIRKAIGFLATNQYRQPGLDAMAAHVNLSPYHFQRLFTRWAGITPKRFLQALTVEQGKLLLTESRSLPDVAQDLGLSGSSRLHDHFVQLEAMTPGEYRNRGRGVQIRYGVHDSPFGRMFVATTARGVCRAAFLDQESSNLQLSALQEIWPLAVYTEDKQATCQVMEFMFSNYVDHRRGPLSVHVAGTNFQVAVWRALLGVPYGGVTSYSQLADSLDRPGGARAVGNAVAANPVALLIPCHRVIQKSGALGGYRWGMDRKQLLLGWERTRMPGAGRLDSADG